VAEHNRRRANSLTTLIGERSDTPPEEHKVASARAQGPYKNAPRRASSGEPSYDRQTWRRLVESDADLLQLTSVLADYGQQYVDELAKDYLAVIDKKRLPGIVDSIIRRARGNGIPRSIGGLENDVKSPTLVGESNVAVHEPYHQQRPSIAAEFKFAMKLPTNPPASVVEAAKQETSSATVQGAFPAGPEPSVGGRNTTITSADQDLTDLFSKFAPDSTFLQKN
jgi:hypothetical protein